ncbi:MazG-like family protein [Streptococcus thermophilus]
MAKFIEVKPIKYGEEQPSMLINIEQIDYVREENKFVSAIFLKDAPLETFTKKPIFDNPMYVKESFIFIKDQITKANEDVSVKDTITDLIAKVNEWAISHGLDKGNPKIEWMKVTEEVGEIRDVFLKPNDFDDPEMALKDAIGDSIVTLVVLCLQLGYDVEECLKIAYNNIKDRQGEMIDDNFVKSKTR